MILEFKGEYRWLSNFEPVVIKLGDYIYPSVEHAYMSAKNGEQEWKLFCMDVKNTAGVVKRKSREIALREDWHTVKFDVMRTCIAQKFSQEPFRTKLIETENQNIVEGNYFGDTVWGVDLKTSPNIGENHLGRMIMNFRWQLVMTYGTDK